MTRKLAVIAFHDENGDIKPIRMQIIEDEEKHAYDIIDPILYDKQKTDRDHITYRYKCTLVDGEIQRQCELFYHVMQTKWTLGKIN
jgi:hypothetical protein